MVGQCLSREKKDEHGGNKEMAKDGSQVERQISTQELPDCIASASVEFETERDDSKRIH